MDNAVLATLTADAFWKDDNVIEDAVAKEKEDDSPMDDVAKENEDDSPMDDAETLPKDKEDPILDHAIHYAIYNTYQEGLSKEKKRAVRKRAATLVVDSDEVYLGPYFSKNLDRGVHI